MGNLASTHEVNSLPNFSTSSVASRDDSLLLTLNKINVYYGKKKRALKNVSLKMGVAGVVGLLGPNGAGKTTLMKVIAGLIKPKGGSMVVGNSEVSQSSKGIIEYRKRIGYLPQRFDLINHAKLLYNVKYAAWLRSVPEKDCHDAAIEALRKVGLDDKMNDKVRSLSGGMRQRLGIACAISNNPEILILDEPTVGLDPAQRMVVRKYIDEYGKDHLVIVSTHLIEDLSHSASKLVVMNEGVVLFDDTMDEFAKHSQNVNEFTSPLESAYYSILSPESTIKEI